MKLTGAILLGMLFVASAAFAEDAWYACEKDDQCMIISGNCGVEWAANKNFADISRNNSPRANMSCKKPIEFHPDNTVARCVKDKCVLTPPGKYAGGTMNVEQ